MTQAFLTAVFVVLHCIVYHFLYRDCYAFISGAERLLNGSVSCGAVLQVLGDCEGAKGLRYASKHPEGNSAKLQSLKAALQFESEE